MRFLLFSVFLFVAFCSVYGNSLIKDNENPTLVKLIEKQKGHDLNALRKLPKNKLPIFVNVGVYLMSVDSFDYNRNTFSATFWVWFVYDLEYKNIINPHETCEIINFTDKKDVSSFKEISGGKVWSGRKIRGTFRYSWDLSKYPVDKQFLQLRIDESDRESSEIRYKVDLENSGFMQNEVHIPGWKINRFDIKQKDIEHTSTYGDPTSKSKNGSIYSAIIVTLELKRESLSTFFKLHTVLFVAFILSWLSTLLDFSKTPPFLAARVATLVSMIYAIVLNIQYVDNIMGTVPTITLPDKFQFATLLMISFFFLQLVVTYKLQTKNKDEISNLIDKYVFILSPFVYVILLLLISIGFI